MAFPSLMLSLLAVALTEGGSCTRGEGGPDYVGYHMNFVEERDGSFTQSGDQITVTAQRPTPSWCKDPTVEAPAVGDVMLWSEYYQKIGYHKLACVGWTEEQHENTRMENPACETAWTADAKLAMQYPAFAQAVGYFPDFLGYDTYESSALDLASFLAHSATETGGGWGEMCLEDNAWCFLNEIGAVENGVTTYGTVANPLLDTNGQGETAGQACMRMWGQPEASVSYIPEAFNSSLYYGANWNLGYWGRGVFQLTHCYNYQYFTQWVENELGIEKTPETNFYSNPGFVATKDWAFSAGIWFYMSPSSDGLKPSMHSVVDTWESGVVLKDDAGRTSDIGYQVNIINGGHECGGGDNPAGLTKRMTALNAFMGRLEYPGAVNGSYLGMDFLQLNGCQLPAKNMGVVPFNYWVNGDLHCSGDSINTCEDDPQCPTRSAPTPAPASTTVATTVPTTVPTTTVPVPSDGTICCVKPGALDSATTCHSFVTEATCTTDSCVWSVASDCANNVIDA